jgi:hypothetical protein
MRDAALYFLIMIVGFATVATAIKGVLELIKWLVP